MRYNQEAEIGPWFTKAHPRNLEVLALRRQIRGQVLPFLELQISLLSYLTSFSLNELWRTTSVGDKTKELDLSDSNPSKFDSII